MGKGVNEGQQSDNKPGKGRHTLVGRSRGVLAAAAWGRGTFLHLLSRIAPGDARVVCWGESHGNGAGKGGGVARARRTVVAVAESLASRRWCRCC